MHSQGVEQQTTIAMLASLASELGLTGDIGKAEFSPWQVASPGRHWIYSAIASAIGVFGLSLSALHQEGSGGKVSVDTSLAALHLNGLDYQRLNGVAWDVRRLLTEVDGITGLYPSANGRLVFIVATYPGLRKRLKRELGLKTLSHDEVAQAVSRRDPFELEYELSRNGLCVTALRTAEEWRGTAQGQYLQDAPLVESQFFSDAPSQPVGTQSSAHPLDGVRVIDFTHVVAGPLAGKNLAQYGAEVIRVSSGDLDFDTDVPEVLAATAIGKEHITADLRTAQGRQRIESLIKTSDVLIDSWRPGTLEKFGFSLERLRELRPGLIYVGVSAYGSQGEMSRWGGFDQNAQTLSGIAHDEGGHLVPTYLFNDYFLGYLTAAAIVATLRQRSIRGGSSVLRLNLTKAAMWLQSFGLKEQSTVVDLAQYQRFEKTELETLGTFEYLAPAIQVEGVTPIFPAQTKLPFAAQLTD